MRLLFVPDLRTQHKKTVEIDPYSGPMLPSAAMNPQEELDQLLARQEALKQELKQRKKELVEAQRQRKNTLKLQIRRAQSRITAAERKRRTRQLILIGSVVKKMADRDSRTRLWLLHALHQDLERTQDRELFDLDPKPENEKEILDTAPPVSTPPPVLDDPLPGWRPHRLDNDEWGSIYLGNPSALPSELVGANIVVESRKGQSWTTTVTAVLDRSSERVIVTDSGRPK